MANWQKLFSNYHQIPTLSVPMWGWAGSSEPLPFGHVICIHFTQASSFYKPFSWQHQGDPAPLQPLSEVFLRVYSSLISYYALSPTHSYWKKTGRIMMFFLLVGIYSTSRLFHSFLAQSLQFMRLWMVSTVKRFIQVLQWNRNDKKM